MRNVPDLSSSKSACCGCSACYSVCPLSAIQMVQDEEGFLYPAIDNEKCIRCYKCLNICAFKIEQQKTKNLISENNSEETMVYGARLLDQNSLMKSSSGGAFTAFSNVFLQNSDAIVCSSYDYDLHQQVYKIITDEKDRNQARGSKYIQSIPGDIFVDTEKWLYENPKKKILFIGVGCQADGFRSFIETKGLRERVTIVDLVCHGSPSPKIWKDYIISIESKKGKINYINFRDKRDGWNNSKAFVKIKEKNISIQAYRRLYSGRYTYRLCCHKCPYTKIVRATDITIGDFWHIEKKYPNQYDNMGTSLIIIHTEKGVKLFEQAKKELNYFESNIENCWQYNLERPTEISPQRELFWKDYRLYGIDYVMKKYGNNSLVNRIMKKIKLLFC